MDLVKSYRVARISTLNKKTGNINGMLVPLWKDYDPIERIVPKYIYYTTCSQGEDKGPYLHKKRRTLIALVEGRIIFVYKDGEKFSEIALTSDENITMLDVPSGVGYLIRNTSDDVARLVNICDHPWRENDNETESPDFNEYYGGSN